MAGRRYRRVSVDRRMRMLWPAVLAVIILLTAPASTGASAGLATQPAPSTATAVTAERLGERDRETGTGQYEAARPRSAVRRLTRCSDLGSNPTHHAATDEAALGRPVGRPPSLPGRPARPSSRTPGACLLIALNIFRT
ncbi:hypothetical protein ACGFNU_03045 [Spirillospora sp. NPDC048911]|uniref:hypothetical protein n=1 Tax=Spirillospora sp. NPDC048911 TaxID=3364527 RepID=UPI0037159A7B